MSNTFFKLLSYNTKLNSLIIGLIFLYDVYQILQKFAQIKNEMIFN